MKHNHALLILPLVLTLALAACSSDDSPTEPEDEVEPTRITETFTGTFGQDEEVFHQFTVVETGDVDMTITELQPVETLTVGLGIGTFDVEADPQCVPIATDTRVVVGATLLSSNIEPGEYCMLIGDVGNVFPDATVTYTVEVVHP